jgi:hypothetical protein
MPDSITKSDWSEYSRLVISELERLNRSQEILNNNYERLMTKLDEFKSEMVRHLNDEIIPIKNDLVSLHENLARQEVIIEHLKEEVSESKEESRYAKRTALGALLSILTALSAALLVWYITHSTLPRETPSNNKAVISKALTYLESGPFYDKQY